MRVTGNPYLFLGPRPFREARLRAHIVAAHRAGTPVDEIARDPYVLRCGSESLFWRVLQDSRTTALLEQNTRDAFAAVRP